MLLSPRLTTARTAEAEVGERAFAEGDRVMGLRNEGDLRIVIGSSSSAGTAAIAAAQVISAPARRAKAWAEANRLVLEQAAAVPLIWSHEPAVHSADVHAVGGSELEYAHSGLRR